LSRARAATGQGITATVREGLKLVAARHAQRELLKLGGTIRFSKTWKQLNRCADVEHVRAALAADQLVLPPPVFTELISDPSVDDGLVGQLWALPRFALDPEFWERAGRLRAAVLARRRRAKLGDALIAQFCLDHDLPLITRDRDFRGFAAVSALRLIA
jgi:predicted nucleic acid-binding protein